MIESILSPELTRALGWTLVHTLWQAAAFSILLAILLLAMRKYSALSRYVVAIGVLSVFFLTAGLTFAELYQPNAAVTVSPIGKITNQIDAEEASSTVAPGPLSSAQASPASAPGWRTRFTTYYEAHLPLIVTLWLLGVLVLQLRFLGQLAFLHRLKHRGAERIPARWLELCQELEAKLSIKKPVRYLQSLRVRSPFTVGWLRPAVLFPTGLLAELDPRQIRSVLAHELAHVKRHDFGVNLLQSLLCILFFYHPAVWWMSARVEEEREHACDDLAVAVTGEKVGYARTLVQLQEQQLGRHALAMNVSGSGFTGRIRRLLGAPLGTGTYGEGFTTAIIIFACIFLAVQLTGREEGALTQVQSMDLNEQSIGVPPPPPPPPPAPAPAPYETEQQLEARIERQAAIMERQARQAAREALALERTEERTEREATNETRMEGQTERQLAALQRMEETMKRKAAEIERDAEKWAARFQIPKPSEWKDTPGTFEELMRAIYSEEEGYVRHLLEHSDIDLNQADPASNFSPLIAAASENLLGIAVLLVDKGAKVDFANSDGWTALIEAADENSLEVLDYLIEQGADVNLQSQGGRTALTMAASEGHPQIIAQLVAAGANVFSISGHSPLISAAGEGQLDVVRALMALEADANAMDSEGRTALLYAAAEGHLDIVEFLLSEGADPQMADREGVTPLHAAAGERQANVVTALLAGGADPNHADRNGRTALMYAAAEWSHRCARALLAANADRELTDDAGRRAIDYARSEEDDVMIEILK